MPQAPWEVEENDCPLTRAEVGGRDRSLLTVFSVLHGRHPAVYHLCVSLHSHNSPVMMMMMT